MRTVKNYTINIGGLNKDENATPTQIGADGKNIQPTNRLRTTASTRLPFLLARKLLPLL